jgi:hypothetical protein
MLEYHFVLLTRVALAAQDELGEVTMESLFCGFKNLPTKLDLSMQQLRLVFERHCDCQVRKFAGNFLSPQSPWSCWVFEGLFEPPVALLDIRMLKDVAH